MDGSWMPNSLFSETSFYVLMVDKKDEITTIGSPDGRSGDVCTGDLTGEEEMSLVLDCLDMDDIEVGPAPEERLFRATASVVDGAESLLGTSGPVLVVHWEDGRTDYLTRSPS
jgi:hypothetical protein